MKGRRSGSGARRNVSAGCLVRASFPDRRRYLIVHPSGNYNRRAPWSIAKGLVDPGEELPACALRETEEETGLRCRIIRSLGDVRYRKSSKRIVGFLAEPVEPVERTVLEPASWEVDRVEFLPPKETRELIHPDQRPFIDRAEENAGESS